MITDVNLKLSLVFELRKRKLLPKFDKKKFWKETFGEKYDPDEEYNYQSVPEVVEYYRKLEIPEELLLKIKELSDPDYDIIKDIYDQWDGEDNAFCICSLEGIGWCKNLEKIDLGVGVDPYQWEKNLQLTYVSLQPFKGMEHLKEIKLGGWMKDIEALKELPALKKLTLSVSLEAKRAKTSAPPKDLPNKTDFENLKKYLLSKGIEVKIKFN